MPLKARVPNDGSPILQVRPHKGPHLFGVGISELFQLPLPTADKVLYVHDVCPGDLCVLPELGPYPGQETGLVLAGT